MNNEPVAWITMSGLSYQQTGLNDRPLYTHPAKTLKQIKGINYWVDAEPKTLTDEEIQEISYEHSKYGSIVNIYDFARAILRKAQEK
jgi:hypothetical protein